MRTALLLSSTLNTTPARVLMALFRLSPAGFERDLAVSLIGNIGNLLQVVKLIVAPNVKW